MKKSIKVDLAIPKQERSIETKAKIFSTALKIFAQNGPHGSRVDQIAVKSGVNKQRIYAYFGSKKNLYREILIDAYTQAATNKQLTELGEKDIDRMTEVIISAFFEFHQSHPLFWRLLSWENLNGGSSLSLSDWSNIRNSYIRHIESLYHLGQSKEIFRKDIDFDTYILAIFSFTYFYFSNQLTISHLLNCRLKAKSVRHIFEVQLHSLLARGTCR